MSMVRVARQWCGNCSPGAAMYAAYEERKQAGWPQGVGLLHLLEHPAGLVIDQRPDSTGRRIAGRRLHISDYRLADTVGLAGTAAE